MLETLRKFFDQRLAGAEAGHDESDVEHALQLATAALLVEMQRADLEVDAVEHESIRELLSGHFELDAEETRSLMQLAEGEADRSVSLHDFTQLLHAHLTPAQKATVVEMLWRVAFVDGRLDPHEEHLVRKIADLLHLPQSAFIKAKERAQGGNG